MPNLISQFAPTAQRQDQLAVDVATVKQDLWNAVQAVLYSVNSIKARAAIHGMRAIKQSLPANERQLLNDLLRDANKMIADYAADAPVTLPDEPEVK